MSELRLDFATDDTVTGFRLEEFELYNWGTFDKRVVSLKLDGANALLTGDIGSGKSTIVDAITTLLVPHQKIIYNKAAGVESKERTLYSYILGEYKSTQDEEFQRQKAIALRDSSNFTVLLARFYNKGYEESFTIAQFFYISSNQVQKFFITSYQKLTIKDDFFNFKDIKGLKKSLREKEHTKVYDTFKEYSRDFTRAMGIKNQQALNLFYQTVSLKSIGNLTEFIRTHMLESSDIDTKIDELCKNFAELNQAYELVESARKQIELLKPINKEGKKYRENLTKVKEYEEIKNSLTLYIAEYKKELLERKVDELKIEITKKISKRDFTQEELDRLSNELTQLKIELEKNGGDRLNTIDTLIKEYSKKLDFTKRANQTYNNLVKSLGFLAVSNEHSFLKVNQELKREFSTIDEAQTKLQNEQVFDAMSLQKAEEKSNELFSEIAYLKQNRSNIPRNISKIRDDMAKSLNIAEEELPFVGELIEVKDKEWEGALQRVLRSFALSLLVDKKHYERVSEYVNSTNLKGKLVYLKVETSKSSPFEEVTPNSLINRIEIKPDTSFLPPLKRILYKRFDISCVESLEEFRRYKKAITKYGQIKLSFTRHEKDDRFDINDKTRWVLGWDNLEKLKQFEKAYEELEQKKEFLNSKIEKNKKSQKELSKKRDSIRDILKYEGFEEINWYRYSKDIDSLVKEREELQKSSDILKTIQDKISKTTIKQKELQESLTTQAVEIGKLEQSLEDRELELNETKLLLDNNSLEEQIKNRCEELKRELLPELKLNLNNINSTTKKLREFVDKNIYNTTRVLQRSGENIVEKMSKFLREFPIFYKEFDASIASLDEFDKKLKNLQKDNLPKWRRKFRELLKEKTVQNIVVLQSTLEEEASQIKRKISTINKSLQDIEYSQGTYIELTAEESKIADIKQFRADLKQATSGSIGEDNNYDEEKFKQIKAIIDRFNGREGFVDVDKKWRKLVSDVRNWFDFSAIERFVSDDSIKEYYAHSGGKSGGQKEKLAYTVLASSLAYQFGLEHNRVQSRSFRFVMIDEAFGRGSDESSRYALRLFEKLRLQLLVITPKQKINVIEPFVKTVHFVHNQEGKNSTLISLKVQEYQKRKSS